MQVSTFCVDYEYLNVLPIQGKGIKYDPFPIWRPARCTRISSEMSQLQGAGARRAPHPYLRKPAPARHPHDSVTIGGRLRVPLVILGADQFVFSEQRATCRRQVCSPD